MSIERIQSVWPEWKIDPVPIGEGSFATVYEARHTEHGITIRAAIKVISIPSSRTDPDSLHLDGYDGEVTQSCLRGIVEDVTNEIKLMQTLRDVPNVVHIEDFRVLEKEDRIGWDILLRMELLKPLNQCGVLGEPEVIRLGIDICSALIECEAEGIIHRDIKPENIFVTERGHYKLGDFGIARKMELMNGSMTQNTGTLNYMAPEVKDTADYDARVDIYSLGLVLYRKLNDNRLPFYSAGKQIYTSKERLDALNRRLSGEAIPPPCQASPEMARILLRACAYDPKKRFSDAAEMKAALEGLRSGRRGSVSEKAEKNAAAKRARKRKKERVRETARVRHTEKAEAKKPANPSGGGRKSKAPAVIVSFILLAALVSVSLLYGPRLLRNIPRIEVRPISGAETAEDADSSPAASEQEEIVAAKITGKVIGTLYGWEQNAEVGAKAAFDGDIGTFFDPIEQGVGYCGIDAGHGKAIILTEVHVYSRLGWEARLDGAVIEGCNDLGNWTVLCTFSGSGSNSVPVIKTEFTNNTGYRYFRYRNDKNHGDVAEIEFYGYGK